MFNPIDSALKNSKRRNFIKLSFATLAFSLLFVSIEAEKAYSSDEGDMLSSSDNNNGLALDYLWDTSETSFSDEEMTQNQAGQSNTRVYELVEPRYSDISNAELHLLLDRHDCIARGFDVEVGNDDAILASRFDFISVLQACLDEALSDIDDASVAQEIREASQRLEADLQRLTGRLEVLSSDLDLLRSAQFSPNSVLRGQVDAHLSVPVSRLNTASFPGDRESNVTFVSRANLNFDTSFTGQDLLRVRLQSGNGNLPLLAFGGYANASEAATENFQTRIDHLYYRFLAGENLEIILSANGLRTSDFLTSTIVPFDNHAVLEAATPQFYRAGMPGGTGIGLSLDIDGRFVLDASYSSSDLSQPVNGHGIGSEPRGTQSYLAQISYLSPGTFNFGLAYLNSNGAGDFVAGRNGGRVEAIGGLINMNFGTFMLGGHIARTSFDGGNDTTFSLGFVIPDIFSEGAQIGVYGGTLPQLVGRDNNPWMIESYYHYPVNENLSVTPALVYGYAGGTGPDNNALYGVFRTTFQF